MTFTDLQLEANYILSTDQSWRKKFGQVFTPLEIASLMVKWVTANLSGGSLLDPALGLGIFFRELANQLATQPVSEAENQETADLANQLASYKASGISKRFKLDGYEIDTNLAALTETVFAGLNIALNCQKEDFLLAEVEKKYDGIICNPPYIHFQEYKYSATLREDFTRLYGLEMNKLSNIYVPFLIKALSLLKPGGRAAFIVPSEFLNADYGTTIKDYLLKSRLLTHLIVFHPTVQLFPGFLTTSAILLFQNGQSDKLLRIVNVSHLDELPAVEQYLSGGASVRSSGLELKAYPYSSLNPDVKWKHYYSDLKINLHLEKKNHLAQFHKFANVRRGIATGANEFFTLSWSDAQKWGIDARYLSPCLTRASQLKHTIFEESDFAELKAKDRKVFLLNLTDQTLDEPIRNYIRWGEEQGFHTRFLTSNRRLWYSMEALVPADLLVKTFGREHAVFVQNNTDVLNLTCFHGIYLNPLGLQYREAIFLYLQTDLARETFEGQKRDYGSGLGKFEPNDIKQANIVDFTVISPADLLVIKQVYEKYIKIYSSALEDCAQLIQQAEQVFWKYW